jgi:hypothetical protein
MKENWRAVELYRSMNSTCLSHEAEVTRGNGMRGVEFEDGGTRSSEQRKGLGLDQMGEFPMGFLRKCPDSEISMRL